MAKMEASGLIPLFILMLYLSLKTQAIDLTKVASLRELDEGDIQRFGASWRPGREANDGPRFGGWKPGRREVEDDAPRFGGFKPGGRREIDEDAPRFGGFKPGGKREIEDDAPRFGGFKPGGKREIEDDAPRFGGFKPGGKREADYDAPRFGGWKPGGRREVEDNAPRFGGFKPGGKREIMEALNAAEDLIGKEESNPFKKLFGRERNQLVNKRSSETDQSLDDAEDINNAIIEEMKRGEGPFGKLFGRDVEKRWPSLSALLHSNKANHAS